MKLHLIPPGEFTMGSSEEEINRVLVSPDTDWMKAEIRNDLPAQRTAIREPFLMGAPEVTIGQFRAFVEATHYKTQAEQAGGGFDWSEEAKKGSQQPQCVWNNPKYVASELHPVGFMGPGDVVKFCAWLSEKDGMRYAVPTGEQWEFACRAGTATRFFFGDDETRLKDFGWIRSNSDSHSQPAGLLRANPFGLFDTLGNVCELTTDRSGAPFNRGGDCHCGWQLARSASRPGTNFLHPRCGFRVVVVGELRPSTSVPTSSPVLKQTVPPTSPAAMTPAAEFWEHYDKGEFKE